MVEQKPLKERDTQWLHLRSAVPDRGSNIAQSGKLHWTPSTMPNYLLAHPDRLNIILAKSNLSKPVLLRRRSKPEKRPSLSLPQTPDGAATLTLLASLDNSMQRPKSPTHEVIEIDFDKYLRSTSLVETVKRIEHDFCTQLRSIHWEKVREQSEYDTSVVLWASFSYWLFRYYLSGVDARIQEGVSFGFSFLSLLAFMVLYEQFAQIHRKRQNPQEGLFEEPSYSLLTAIIKRVDHLPFSAMIEHLLLLVSMTRHAPLFKSNRVHI